MQTRKGRATGLETGAATTDSLGVRRGRSPHGPTRGGSHGGRTARTRLTTLGLVVLCAALLFTPARDVPLVFDSLSYAAQGAGLARGHGNVVSIGGELHPGIYPIGVPLLLAPAIAVTGDLRTAIWSIFACAVLCVLVTAGVARRLAGSGAGLLAALLLLSSGAFRDCATNVFSQVPTALAVVATAWLFVTARGPGRLAGAGALAVLSVLLRNANAGFPVALVAAACLVGPGDRGRRLLAVAAGIVPAAVVVLAHNALLYGEVWSTGYDLWGWPVGGQYSLRHVIGGEASRAFARGVTGFGRLYSVPLALAAAFGVCRAWRRRRADPRVARLAVLTCAAVAAQSVVHVPHAFFAEIYLVPTVPLLAAVAAVGLLGPRPRTSVGSDRRDVRVAAASVVALVLIGVSLGSDAPLSAAETGAVRVYASLDAIDRVAEPDAVLLTTAPPAMAEPLFLSAGQAGRRSIVYLEVYASGPLGDLGRKQFGPTGPTPELVLERVEELLGDGRPTYYGVSAPAAGVKSRHRAIHAALRKALDLRPTRVDGICRLDLPRTVE